MDFEVAKKFALENVKEGMISVVYEINFKKENGLFALTSEYSAYPNEQEVLVQDGLEYSIMAIEDHENNNNPYTIIRLEHPPNK